MSDAASEQPDEHGAWRVLVDELETARRRADAERAARLAERLGERLRASAREGESFYAAVFDGIDVELAILDDIGRLIAVNRAWRDFARAHGMRDPTHGVGANYLELCESATGPFADSAHRVADGLRGVLDGARDGFQLEYPCPTPTKELWFKLRASRLPESSLLVVSHEDITARRRAETELHQRNEDLHAFSRRLSEANRELEAFSQSVSHDLRAPLRAIDTLAERVLDESATAMPESARDLVERIRSEAGAARERIAELMSLSRAGGADLRDDVVDLSAITHEMLDAMRRHDPERRVETSVQPDLVVRGDAPLLRVVMENLLDNAWKYTAPRAHARIEVGAIREGHEVPVFFVRDNGIGFDPRQATRLFQPFQRLATGIRGTGLGLVTVRRIVRRHHGDVWAAGEPDRGATFFFTLHDPHARNGA